MTARRERRPWRMRWIVLALVLFIPAYTWVNLRYRKPGPMFRPYQDMKDRAGVIRLLGAGFRRMELEGTFPPESADAGIRTADQPAQVEDAQGGVPGGLRETLIDAPQLPATVAGVRAPAAVFATVPYRVRFGCRVPDADRALAGATLYQRGGLVVLVPVFERLPGGLRARSADQETEVALPAGTLRPGRYRCVIAGASAGRAWTFIVH